jgi:hypothetical protein
MESATASRVLPTRLRLIRDLADRLGGVRPSLRAADELPCGILHCLHPPHLKLPVGRPGETVCRPIDTTVEIWTGTDLGPLAVGSRRALVPLAVEGDGRVALQFNCRGRPHGAHTQRHALHNRRKRMRGYPTELRPRAAAHPRRCDYKIDWTHYATWYGATGLIPGPAAPATFGQLQAINPAWAARWACVSISAGTASARTGRLRR